MNSAIPFTVRFDLLLSPPRGTAGRHAVKDLRTGACYTLGAQEYFVLARLDGERSAAALCREFRHRFDEDLTEVDVQDFVALARERGFLEPVSEQESAQAAQDEMLEPVPPDCA